ncbi:MAG: HEPN domain-containing protein [Myxococcales bacterium]
MRATPPFTGDAVFHAQQAVEKSAKAFLTWQSSPFRKTHNIAELGAACRAFDETLEPAFLGAAGLTDFAWRYRYPGAPVDPSVEEAATVLALARVVFDAVIGRLPPEVRP